MTDTSHHSAKIFNSIIGIEVLDNFIHNVILMAVLLLNLGLPSINVENFLRAESCVLFVHQLDLGLELIDLISD